MIVPGNNVYMSCPSQEQCLFYAAPLVTISKKLLLVVTNYRGLSPDCSFFQIYGKCYCFSALCFGFTTCNFSLLQFSPTFLINLISASLISCFKTEVRQISNKLVNKVEQLSGNQPAILLGSWKTRTEQKGEWLYYIITKNVCKCYFLSLWSCKQGIVCYHIHHLCH